ncbi:hypothetical protein [Flavobacterium sp. GCM10027622]|uniref:hypothetical protein n=1 Tax=unclassified Flavobacterium TaxID=196869 RepID=UPI003613890D
MITSEELITTIENVATESNMKVVAENLLEAIRDWPTENLTEPSEFVSELKLQINSKLTFENIDNFLKTLCIEKDAWKMESLTSVLEIFDFERNGKVDKEVELEVLLERITNHIK